jgi:uncharacterized protein
MNIVLDTNVLISALIKRNSNPVKIFDAVLTGKVRLVVNRDILQEYSQVLGRERFMIPVRMREEILAFIRLSSIWAEEKEILDVIEKSVDPRDIPFVGAAITSNVDALVTGNAKHFQHFKALRVKVLSPGEFIQIYGDILGL